MKQILKDVIPVDDQWHQVGGPIVHVQEQYDQVTVWFEHDDEAPPAPVTVRVFGTGQPLPDEPTRHVGTAILRGAWLAVWHVRELLPTPEAEPEPQPQEPTEQPLVVNVTSSSDPVEVGRQIAKALKAYEQHGGRA